MMMMMVALVIKLLSNKIGRNVCSYLAEIKIWKTLRGKLKMRSLLYRCFVIAWYFSISKNFQFTEADLFQLAVYETGNLAS